MADLQLDSNRLTELFGHMEVVAQSFRRFPERTRIKFQWGWGERYKSRKPSSSFMQCSNLFSPNHSCSRAVPDAALMSVYQWPKEKNFLFSCCRFLKRTRALRLLVHTPHPIRHCIRWYAYFACHYPGGLYLFLCNKGALSLLMVLNMSSLSVVEHVLSHVLELISCAVHKINYGYWWQCCGTWLWLYCKGAYPTC